MTEKKNAVGYVRCSTDQQEDSPEQQRKAITAFAEANDYKITGWYVDFGRSGTTFDQRPEFQRLRLAVDSHPTFNAVICYDESRWGRAIDAEENTYWRVHFRKRKVEVLLVKTAVDNDHEFAPMLKAFEGVQASQYSKKLSELTLRGTLNNGKYSSGGTAPYGYRRLAINLKTGVERALGNGEWCVKKQEKVTWVPGDPDEIENVRLIFQQRASGLAYVIIAKGLNDRAMPCARRGKWRNRDQKWSAGTIKSMLENPAYYGARAYNRNSSSKIIAKRRGRDSKENRRAPVWRNDAAEWVIVPDAHLPIVPKELWDRANIVKKREMRRRNVQTYFSRYLLTGLVKCSRCGFAFQGWSGSVRGKKYYRYIDGGWQSKRVCEFTSIPQDQIEAFALAAVRETLGDPDMPMKLDALLRGLHARRDNSLSGDRGLVSNEIEIVNQKIRNLLDLVEVGTSGGVAIRTRLAELEREKATLTTSLRELDLPFDSGFSGELTGQVREFIDNFDQVYKEAPIEERKALIQKCISSIVVDRDAYKVHLYVRTIPAITPHLETLLQPVEAENLVMSGESARNT